MLRNEFGGRRFTVRGQDGTKLDCMFFPFNDEKVLTREELKHENVGVEEPWQPTYLKYPTLIFFNPNA